MKDMNELALVAMADPVHRPRKPVADSPKFPPAQPSTDAGLHAVFDSSGEALVLIDSVGVIQRANRRARDLLRLKDASIRRQGLRDLLPKQSGPELSLWCAQKTPPGLQTLETSLASGFAVRITLRAILPGSHHLLLCLEEGSIVQRAEAKWRLVDAELRSVLDCVPIGIIVFDLSGRVRFSSAQFGELFGLDARELEKIENAGQLEELVAGRFRNSEAFAAPWKSFVRGAGEAGHDELEIMRPARRVLERFWRPVLDAEGRAVGWLELLSDVTGKRQIQSKMLQTEKMAALGQLVSGIAHELNNPLTAIMGYAQLLLGHGLAPAQLSEASKVYHEAERARRIVKNLLYFARENKPERTRVDLNEIVERTLALRSYELRVENIVVECDLAPGLPQTMADPYQLQQVVLNLVVNAEQALLEGRGQGHIRIRTSHVIQGVGKRAEHRILVEVSDDGPGIPPEIASRIFDPFFTSKPPGVGTGLGLSIVYGMVHQHGGEVTFESQPGAGAKFVVELPVMAAQAPDRAAALPRAAGKAGAVATGRVLVVEDEPTVAQLIVDVLREEGHQVEAALDSQEGLTRLSRSRYDLVICDLRMPRLDGPAFYDALVRAGSPVRNRILFITGDMLAPRTTEFLESRGLPYLAKPFLVEELKLAVNRLLDPARQDGAEAQHAVAPRRAGDGTAGVKGVPRATARGNAGKYSQCDWGALANNAPSTDLIMDVAAKPAVVPTERSALLGVADETLVERLAREVERFSGTGGVMIASSLLQLRQLASRCAPDAMLLDGELLDGRPLAESLRPLTAIAPVILLAPVERQAEAARLVADGDVEFVARAGDFIPLAAGLLERRLRWAAMSECLLGPPWAEVSGDLGEIFRHEINNPLTGILGNAELLLAHRDRLGTADTQRLQTVVDLAVRLRETIRRLSNAWESRTHSLKSA